MTKQSAETQAVQARTQANILRAEQNLQRQLDWIGRFDTRSATVLGIAVGMLGFLATEAPSPAKWTTLCIVGSALSIIATVISLVGIYFGQFPRMGSPNASLVYFGTIAGLKADEFIKKFCNQPDDEHLNDVCQQTHLNSTLMKKKFTALKVALIALLVAVPFWAFTIALFRIVKA